MLSRNLYRMKKSPLANKRRKFIIGAIIALCVILVIFTVIRINSFKKNNAKKSSVTVATGDQPVTKDLEVYINADGGLSLRKDRSSSSERLALIPNGTKLKVTQELEGWYKVNYENKNGWISKEYTTTTAPIVDATKDWKTFSGSGYKIKYQIGWSVQDYGRNDTAGMTSVVAFSNQTLPATIPSGSDFIAPVVVNVSSKTVDSMNQTYAAMSGVTVEDLSVAGQTAKKYTYMSPTSNTQVTAVIMAINGKALVLTEAGGYYDDLLKMLNTLTIG